MYSGVTFCHFILSYRKTLKNVTLYTQKVDVGLKETEYLFRHM